MSTLRLVATLASVVLLATPLTADHDHGAMDAEPLGKVHFPISCGAAQQAAFDRGVALLHSFGYERAEAAFNAIAAAEPTCGMAFWGAAMSNFHPVWGPSSPAEFDRGKAAAQKAADVGSADPREKAWIAAIDAFYLESAPRTHP